MTDSESSSSCNQVEQLPFTSEEKLSNEYFSASNELIVLNSDKLREFGTIQSSVGSTAVIQALSVFDLIGEANVSCGNFNGQIFDILGPQPNLLYVARFNGDVTVNSKVFIDISSIIKYQIVYE